MSATAHAHAEEDLIEVMRVCTSHMVQSHWQQPRHRVPDSENQSIARSIHNETTEATRMRKWQDDFPQEHRLATSGQNHQARVSNDIYPGAPTGIDQTFGRQKGEKTSIYLLDHVGGEHKNIRLGSERLRCSEIPDALVREFLRRHDLDDVERGPVDVVPHHVHLRHGDDQRNRDSIT